MCCTNSNIWVVLFRCKQILTSDSQLHLLSEGQIKCFYFHLETQRLPDTAASTVLRLLKPRLLSLREHLGGIKQIYPHRDVDMRGREWANLVGFETLVFASLGISSMQEQLATL